MAKRKPQDVNSWRKEIFKLFVTFTLIIMSNLGLYHKKDAFPIVIIELKN